MIPFIDIHTHLPELNPIVQIVNAELFHVLNTNLKYSIGIHPWDIDKTNIEESINWIKENFNSKDVLAIGEIGIDRAIKISLEKQTELFIRQHQLAEKAQKPIIIHCVRAWSDMLALHKQLKPSSPWIFHGYIGNLKVAQQLIKKGCYLSFGAALITSEKVQNVFVKLPLSSVFLETDDCGLEIELIYTKAATLRRICVADLKQVINANLNKVLHGHI